MQILEYKLKKSEEEKNIISEEFQAWKDKQEI